MTDEERAIFDELVEEALEELPSRLIVRFEEIPLIVLDRPEPATLAEMGLPPDTLLCGLHTGVALTERSVEASAELPDKIEIYREGILDVAGGWVGDGVEDTLYDEVVITILHELGHHFGLEEDDLEDLGYA